MAFCFVLPEHCHTTTAPDTMEYTAGVIHISHLSHIELITLGINIIRKMVGACALNECMYAFTNLWGLFIHSSVWFGVCCMYQIACIHTETQIHIFRILLNIIELTQIEYIEVSMPFLVAFLFEQILCLIPTVGTGYQSHLWFTKTDFSNFQRLGILLDA